MYDNNMIMSLKQKKRKFEPRIKLNHNIYSRGGGGGMGERIFFKWAKFFKPNIIQNFFTTQKKKLPD